MPVARLVRQLADRAQACTQRSWKRPYGVGMLIAGVDATGPHLFNTCPSGNYYEFSAAAIGARAQAAKTYLEKHAEGFAKASLDELAMHGLKALSGSLQARRAALLCVGPPALGACGGRGAWVGVWRALRGVLAVPRSLALTPRAPPKHPICPTTGRRPDGRQLLAGHRGQGAALHGAGGRGAGALHRGAEGGGGRQRAPARARGRRRRGAHGAVAGARGDARARGRWEAQHV